MPDHIARMLLARSGCTAALRLSRALHVGTWGARDLAAWLLASHPGEGHPCEGHPCDGHPCERDGADISAPAVHLLVRAHATALVATPWRVWRRAWSAADAVTSITHAALATEDSPRVAMRTPPSLATTLPPASQAQARARAAGLVPRAPSCHGARPVGGGPPLQVDAVRAQAVLQHVLEGSADAACTWGLLASRPALATQLLLHASGAGNPLVCSFLLHHGLARADAQCSEALVVAAWRDHPAVCSLLMGVAEHAALPSAQDNAALLGAAYWGHTRVCRLLLTAVHSPPAGDARASLALVHAADDGNIGACRLLMRAGARADDRGSLALQVAATQGHEQVCRALLSAPRHRARADDMDSSALVTAASSGHLGVCRLLLATSPNAAHACAQDSEPLMAAARQGHWDVCRLLLHRGGRWPARANARDCEAIIYAARDHYDAFCMLLDMQSHAAWVDLPRCHAQIRHACATWLRMEDADAREAMVRDWMQALEAVWRHYQARQRYVAQLQTLRATRDPGGGSDPGGSSGSARDARCSKDAST